MRGDDPVRLRSSSRTCRSPQLRLLADAPSWRKKVVPWLFVLPILLINMAVVLGPGAFRRSTTR